MCWHIDFSLDNCNLYFFFLRLFYAMFCCRGQVFCNGEIIFHRLFVWFHWKINFFETRFTFEFICFAAFVEYHRFHVNVNRMSTSFVISMKENQRLENFKRLIRCQNGEICIRKKQTFLLTVTSCSFLFCIFVFSLVHRVHSFVAWRHVSSFRFWFSTILLLFAFALFYSLAIK